MRRVLSTTLLVSSLTVAAALPAEAAFVVQSRKTPFLDQVQHIAQDMRVKTDSTTPVNIGGLTIRYYFYEPDLPVTWSIPSGTNVTKLDKTYTCAGGKNANYVLSHVVPQDTMIVGGSSPQNYTKSFNLGASPLRNLTQTEDYSYANNGSYTDNPNITFQVNSGGTLWGNWPANDRPTQLALARQKLKHIIVIMQENRTFDNYFGNFPNPTGFVTPRGTIFPWPALDGIAFIPNEPGDRVAACNGLTYNPAPLTQTSTLFDLPHFMGDAKKALGCATPAPPDKTCAASGPLKIKDYMTANGSGCDPAKLTHTVGYYDGSTSSTALYNYWTIAKSFLLQDRMFAPVPSFSKMTHLFMVSAWSANCSTAPCSPSQENYADVSTPYAWKDISSALHDSSVSWGFYKGENYDYNCSSCNASNPLTVVSNCFTRSDGIVWFWSPLTDFVGVQQRGNTGKVQPLQNFLTAISQGEATFPKVSWIVPGLAVSEHLQGGDLKHGQAYVTMVLQQIMKNTALWQSSAVFVAWDDWGGFQDHVRPPTDSAGNLMYGIRVPGLTISPWLGIGALDRQTLSFDAYLKFIEDIFLNGQRLTGDGRPTPVREDQSVLGDLLTEFDFNRTLKAPPTAVTGLSCQAP